MHCLVSHGCHGSSVLLQRFPLYNMFLQELILLALQSSKWITRHSKNANPLRILWHVSTFVLSAYLCRGKQLALISLEEWGYVCISILECANVVIIN
jgi:hypothetical protein